MRNATALRRSLQTQVSHTFNFCSGGNWHEIAISGWSNSEPQHVWAVGKRTVLALRNVIAPHGFFIEFDWHPFATEPYRQGQALILTCGERMLSPFFLRQHEISAFFCPALPRGEVNFHLTIEVPDAIPCNEYPGIVEQRSLTIAFHRLRIIPLTAPMPPLLNNYSAAPFWTERRVSDLIANKSTNVDLRGLFNRFEMLAGNCDLGLVVRTLGTEQLSLLRFAGATPDVAMRGLETNFDGLGENLTAEIANNHFQEWMVRDDFGLRFHTHQSSADVAESAILRRQRTHIEFLKRKFLEDLALNEKIFVFADHIRPHAYESALALFLTLSRQQPRKMLWVCPSTTAANNGRVDELVPGFYRGQLDRFGGPLAAGHIAVSGWLNVLENARVLTEQLDTPQE